MRSRTFILHQLTKLLWREAALFRDISHRVSVDRICSWDLDSAQAITHGDMLTLTDDDESDFLQRADRCQMINAGPLWHSARQSLPRACPGCQNAFRSPAAQRDIRQLHSECFPVSL